MAKDWYGLWPGIVVDDADPDRMGRLRIRVPQVYGAPAEGEKIEDWQLPWAIPGAFISGSGSGMIAVPPVGAAVFVGFVGGDAETPVWVGGWFPDAHVPGQFSGAYEPGPKTWLMRTPNGHVIEMRYKGGEERIEITSAGGYHFLLDDVQQKALLETPTQRVEMSDLSSTILVSTPGQVNVQAGGPATVQGGTVNITSGGVTNMTGTGASIMTYAAGTWQFAALAINSLAALALTAAGVLTLTGAGLVIATTGGAIALGSVAGTKKRLVTEDGATKYNTHTHGGAVGAPPAGEQINLAPASTEITQSLTAD